MKYIIIKASRVSRVPYSGPSCKEAGLPSKGIYYSDKKSAEIDALKLSKVNPVGFRVIRVSK